MFGRIHVITGCAKSGKTRELGLWLERYALAGLKVRDIRIWDNTNKFGDSDDSGRVDEHFFDVQVVGLDDCHLASMNLDKVIIEASHKGKGFIVAGRDQDEEGRPFMPVARLIGLADSVTKLCAVCSRCGSFYATRTARSHFGQLEARCNRCHSRGSLDDLPPGGSGRIVLLCGCMFSGKTSELIRRLQRLQLAGHRVILFRPDVDSRCRLDKVVSHDGVFSFDSVTVSTPAEILTQVYSQRPRAIGIDEAQFFCGDIVETVISISELSVDVIISMLDQDSFESLWEESIGLFGIADELHKLTAICSVCGGEASKTYRISRVHSKVFVGGPAEYEARCHGCFPH